MKRVAGTPDGKLRFSISQLATELGMARDTVTKRLREASIEADGTRQGYPVYRLRDVIGVLGGSSATNGAPNPDDMNPTDRRAWYQAETVKTDLAVKHGQLIPAAEHEAGLAKMTKSLVQFCDTLPDVLERDLSLDGEQVEQVQKVVDQMRTRLYEEVSA